MEITELDKTFVHIAILELWEKFMPEKTYELDGVERLNLEMYKDNFYVLTQWLKNDVIYLISLTYSEREQQIAFLEEINSWIKERLGTELYSKITKSEFSLEKIKRRLEIQSDWERAIDDVKEHGGHVRLLNSCLKILTITKKTLILVQGIMKDILLKIIKENNNAK